MTFNILDRHYHQSATDQLGLEASTWLVRLLDPDPNPHDPYFEPLKRNEGFLEWIGRSPQHAALFRDTYEAYRKLGNIDSQHQISIRALLRDRWKDYLPVAPKPADRPRARGFRVGAIAAAVLTVMALGTSQYAPNNTAAPVIYYSTAVGQHSTFPLPDGSTVALNTDSRIAVTLGKKTRKVQLINGEVFINAQHDINRPFLVESDNLTVTDVGTQFDVYKHAFGTQVSVLEGSVHVTCDCNGRIEPSASNGEVSANSAAAGHPSADLTVGEQLNFTKIDGRITRRTQTLEELRRAILWKEGQLSFRGESLAEVVREFNRYTTRQFVIADPAIATLRVAGSFASPDPAKLIENLRERWRITASDDPTDPNVIRLGRLK